MGFLPLNLRALIFILIAFTGAWFYLYRIYDDREELKKWAQLWLVIICTAYIIPSFWGIIIAVCAIGFVYIPKSDIHRVTMYFLLMPLIAARIGYSLDFLPGINYLFEINYIDLLILVILLPGLINTIKETDENAKTGFLNSSIDFFVISYSVLISVLQISRQPSITAGLREVFLNFVNILVPYYAISRSVTSLKQFISIYKAIVYSSILVACVGILEQMTKWSFYTVLPQHLQVPYYRFIAISSYRSGFMRIKSLIGEEIPLGFFLMISIGAAFFFRHVKSKKKLANPLILLLLASALYFTDSRGAQLGTMLLLFIYLLFMLKSPVLKFLLLGGTALIFSAFMASDTTIESIDQHGTFIYRIELVQNAIPVINDNYWFGTNDFWEAEELEDSRQGQGIIDIVNTYLLVALVSGMSGFILFSLIFLSSALSVFRKIRSIRSSEYEENRVVGVILLSMLISAMFVIATVSPVGHIPYYCWALVGLCSAFSRLSENEFMERQVEEIEDIEKIEQEYFSYLNSRR